MILECVLTFEAAHRNASARADERTARLHGHSYEVTVAVAGPLDPALGWVMDYAEIKERAKSVIDRLDHRVLNDVEGMNGATVADVTRWMTERLRPLVPSLHECRATILGERDWRPVVARLGDGYERLRFGFAAAHYLPALAETHKCRRVHGHSFRAAVTAADASPLAGPLGDIYRRLDHRLLNDLPGLANPTSEMLAHWLDDALAARRVRYHEIRVAETCTASCRLIKS